MDYWSSAYIVICCSRSSADFYKGAGPRLTEKEDEEDKFDAMGNKIEVSLSRAVRQDNLLTNCFREPRRRLSSLPPSFARRRRTEWPAASVVRRFSPTRTSRLIARCDSIQIDERSSKWHGRSYDTVTSDFRSSDLIMVYIQTRFMCT